MFFVSLILFGSDNKCFFPAMLACLGESSGPEGPYQRKSRNLVFTYPAGVKQSLDWTV